MKKPVSLLLAVALAMGLAACGASAATPQSHSTESTIEADSQVQNDPAPVAEGPAEETHTGAGVPGTQEKDQAQSEQQAILIAYFSRTGSTGQLAEAIQAQVGGDLVRIEPLQPYPDEYSEVLEQAREEQAAGSRPVLTTQIDNMEQYDTVFIGYPIWHGDVPMAILSFMESYDWTGKTVVPFCTHGGGGAYSSFGSVAAAAGGAQMGEGLSIAGSAVDDVAGQVAAWLEELGLGTKAVEGIMRLYLTIGEHTLTATLEDNSSAEALRELLAAGPATIDMRDYAGMEKVGDLGATLPENNGQITTAPGDLILYQGSSFVIYYAANTWSLTRLGRIEDVTAQQLRDILGDGDVRVTLSLGE